ncbi:AAA family ATPase [Alicyclobacillus ferrooxydans]|uniref:YhaN AAA domain-containing protein n=1 Tax=Alicyclobacillus ferrooxydans TaxID=471514 RepID=A0A0P9CGC7_9BACL|nr:AAA family ATPase [Alicyclobacillus ferrooxydans]KPV44606.1 hypothetical protein AN477_06325 [Alicyclobacillus ferrooxydans]
MRIRRLGIQNVLHFDEFELDFGRAQAGLHIVYGPNEAGKSTILRVLVDLLFGGKIDDAFKDSYGSKSRIAGVLEAGHDGSADEVAAGDASTAWDAGSEEAGGPRTGTSTAAGESRGTGGTSGSALPVSPRELAIVRKKRYSNLVLSDDAQGDIPEEVVLSLLGGLDKERYTLLFGFNHDRLRIGGDSLLESGGHAGISLFEAGGGIQFLQNVFTELSSRTDALLDTGFRSNSKKALNAAWRAYKDLKDGARRNSLRGEDWHRLKNEIAVKEVLLESLQRELKEFETRGNQLRRISRTRHFVANLNDAKLRLDAMMDAVELTPEMDGRIQSDVAGLEQADKQIHEKTQDLKTATESLESIDVDSALLDASGAINSLNRRIEQYLEAAKTVPRLQQQIEAEESKAREMARDLAPSVDFGDVDKLWIPAKDDLEIRQLAILWTELARELKQASDNVVKLDQDIRHREEELGKLAQSPDLSPLRQVLDEVQRSGDLESTLVQLERDMKGKREAATRQLQSQSIWNGQLEGLARMPVPLGETVAQFADKFLASEQQIADSRREINKRYAELENINDQIAVLELSGRVPVEADLVAARLHRDNGWRLIRTSWLGETDDDARGKSSLADAVQSYAAGKALPEAFEDAVSEADSVADWMRRESDRSARLSQFQLQRERTENVLSRLNSELEKLTQEHESLQSAWVNEWSTSGVTPKSPVEMKGWLADYYRPLIKEIGEIQGLERRIGELTVLRDSLMAQLGDALKATRQMPVMVSLAETGQASQAEPKGTPEEAHGASRTFDSLRSLISAATRWIGKVDSEEKLREALLVQYKELRANRDKEAALGRLKKEDFAGAKERWTQFTAAYPFLPENLQVVTGYLDKLRELFGLTREIGRLEDAMASANAVCTSFEQDTTSLAQRIGRDIEDGISYSGFVENLTAAMTEAGQEDRERRLLLQQVSKLHGELERRKSDKAALEAVVAGYKEKYHCLDHEALRVLVMRSEEKKKLRAEIDQIESSLRRVGDGMGAAELVAEVEHGPGIDALPSLEQELAASHEAKKKTCDLETRALWELNQQFFAMNEDKSDAADSAQQAEFQLAEVDRYWNEYLRFELARRLLGRAIEEFREQNESTVIERASELFRHLTLGHYTELVVEYDGSEPVLEAITAIGERRRVHQMSDGTRDQLYLALRLAFVEQHVDNASPVPLIMDDILVHFDDARTQATLEVLNQLAQKTQILYFTHHQSIVEAAAAMADAGSSVLVHTLVGSGGLPA